MLIQKRTEKIRVLFGSRLRRKRFFEITKEETNKIVLGHNKDDLIKTLFINNCYAGKIATMKPKQTFFNGELDITWPLSYLEKEDILKFEKGSGLPAFVNNCPVQTGQSVEKSEQCWMNYIKQ
jgi:tRNA 2-thiocytidine biosynthesis protein TtcA